MFSQPLDCVGKIEIDAAAAGSDAAAFVANFLCRARRNIARRKVAIAWIFSLEIIIAIRLVNFTGRLVAIFLTFRNPDASIIPERLGHERELGLVFATDRDAGGMNLREGRIREERASFVSTICGRDIASARVGREIKHVSISASREHHSIRSVSLDFSGTEIAGDDSLGMSLNNHQVEHLSLWKHLHCAGRDLTAKRLITAEQKLLTGLSARVERDRHLGAAEGTISQQAPIFAGKWHALRDALVDDVIGDLSEPIHIRFTGTKIAA